MEPKEEEVSSLKDFDFGGDYDEMEGKDPVEYSKERNEERLESESESRQREGREILNLQNALNQTFSTLNNALESSLGKSDPLVRSDDEINNLAIVWGEYLGSEIGKEKLRKFIKQVPLFCAIGYTGVVYGSAIKQKIDNTQNQELKLEKNNGKQHEKR